MLWNRSIDHVNVQNPHSKKVTQISVSIQILLICGWLYFLRNTSSYYSVYVLCAAVGVFCVIENGLHPLTTNFKDLVLLLIFSVWFASTTVLANYRLFIVKPVLERILSAMCALLGGTVIAYQVTRILAARIPFPVKERDRKLSPAKFYILSFCIMESLFLAYLLGRAYPAYFSNDVYNALGQIATGVYENKNPFWYTISIKVIAGMGYQIFGNANAAIAWYVFWQGIFMSAVASYVLVTLYQIGVPGWAIGATGVIYGLLPYNLAFSATLLKDIPFGISFLLFVASLYRIIRRVGKKQNLNYIFFTIGAFIFCLMRTNGLASFFVTVLMVLLLLKKFRKRVLIVLSAAILVLSWFLTNPLLEKWNVGSMDFVEGLAVPFQQIARVITMGYTLEPDEYELLNKIFDVEMIPDVFTYECVDTIKSIAFRADGRLHLKENMKTYVALWLDMGRKYPGEYLKAWIDLTNGYWNGGYDFEIYYTGGGHAGYGLIRPETMPLQNLFDSYFTFMENCILIQPLCSIGLHVWLLFACLVLNIKQKRAELVLTIPGIIIILGLWLGAPLNSEFRYAYPMILSIPLLICTTLYHKN